METENKKTKWSMSTEISTTKSTGSGQHWFNIHQHSTADGSKSSMSKMMDPTSYKLKSHKFDETLNLCQGDMSIVMRISDNSLLLDRVLLMLKGLAEQIKVSLDQI